MSRSISSTLLEGPHLSPSGFLMPRQNSTWAWSGWRVRSPIHSMWPEVAVPVAAGRIHARHRLLVAEQQRLVAGVEIGRAQLRMAFEIEPAGLHESERLRDLVGELHVTARLRAVLDEAQHPLAHIAEIGVAALGEGAQQVERRGRLPIGRELAARIGDARLGRELGPVDDVAAIDRQLPPVALLDRRAARLGELAGDAADLHHRRGGRIGEHHRHLQEQAEEVADVVGAVLGEAFGAVAALQQESVAGRDLAQRLGQVARLAGENQRRKGRQLRLDLGQRGRVGIFRHLQDRLACASLRASIARP